MKEKIKNVFSLSSEIFDYKLMDYGASFRVMNMISIADQLYIKVNNLRNNLNNNELTKNNIISLINYSIIGFIQKELGVSNKIDIENNVIKEKYSYYTDKVIELLFNKNKEYGNVWINMEILSIIDLIFVKIVRMKYILSKNKGKTSSYSEGIDNSLYDIIGYSIYLYMKLFFKDI